MVNLFRILVIVANLAYVAWFFQPYYSPVFYSNDVMELLRSDGFSGVDFLLKYSVEIGWLLLVLFLVTAVGLLLYIKAARTLFVVLIIGTLILRMFYGVSVQSNIDSTLMSITAILDGAILYMIYFSSLAEKFLGHNNHLQIDAATPRD